MNHKRPLDRHRAGVALTRVIKSWQSSQAKQLRNTLPAEFTSTTLRYIRTQACLHRAGNGINCLKWLGSDHGSALIRPSTSRAAMQLTSNHVCGECKHPEITSMVFIREVGLSSKKVNFSDRTLRRYANDGDPIPTEQIRLVIANSVGHRWLTVLQGCTLNETVDDLEVAQKTLRTVSRRIKDRMSYDSTQIDFDLEELLVEYALQQRLQRSQHRANMAAARARGKLPVEALELIDEILFSQAESSRQHD